MWLGLMVDPSLWLVNPRHSLCMSDSDQHSLVSAHRTVKSMTISPNWETVTQLAPQVITSVFKHLEKLKV